MQNSSPIPPLPGPNTLRLTHRLAELRKSIALIDPDLLAFNTSAAYEQFSPAHGTFLFNYWGKPISISYPELIVQEPGTQKNASEMTQAIILYYLQTADGTPLQGNWISFAELEDGRFYNQAFQGYTGQEISRFFQNDQGRFSSAALKLGGEASSSFPAAYAFLALPRVPLLINFWAGDEDFPSSCQVLFDGSASHYLPTDAYAILGSTLTRQLIASI